jgi:hypothetical protein
MKAYSTTFANIGFDDLDDYFDVALEKLQNIAKIEE